MNHRSTPVPKSLYGFDLVWYFSSFHRRNFDLALLISSIFVNFYDFKFVWWFSYDGFWYEFLYEMIWRFFEVRNYGHVNMIITYNHSFSSSPDCMIKYNTVSLTRYIWRFTYYLLIYFHHKSYAIILRHNIDRQSYPIGQLTVMSKDRPV